MEKLFGKVRVAKIEKSAFKENVYQAELRLEQTRIYGSNISNDYQENLFDASDFAGKKQVFKSDRVTWIEVPEGTTVEQLQERLDNSAQPFIYRVESFEPIFTSADYGYMTGLSKEKRDEFIKEREEKQRVVNPETGEVVTKAGRKIYARMFFTHTGKTDILVDHLINAFLRTEVAETLKAMQNSLIKTNTTVTPITGVPAAVETEVEQAVGMETTVEVESNAVPSAVEDTEELEEVTDEKDDHSALEF